MTSAAYDDLFALPPGVEEADMRPRARATDPATSHQAAVRAKRFVYDHASAIVGNCFRPSTIYDLAKRTGLTEVQVARRMKDIVAGGRLRDTGETAMGPNGVHCTVYDQVVTQ